MNRLSRPFLSKPFQTFQSNSLCNSPLFQSCIPSSNKTFSIIKNQNGIKGISNNQIRNYAVPRHHVKARRYKMSKWVPQSRYQVCSIFND